MSTQHATRSDTLPDPVPADCHPAFAPGGHWVATCLTCGWELEGCYPPGKEAEALTLANLRGDLHEAAERIRGAGRG